MKLTLFIISLIIPTFLFSVFIVFSRNIKPELIYLKEGAFGLSNKEIEFPSIKLNKLRYSLVLSFYPRDESSHRKLIEIENESNIYSFHITISDMNGNVFHLHTIESAQNIHKGSGQGKVDWYLLTFFNEYKDEYKVTLTCYDSMNFFDMYNKKLYIQKYIDPAGLPWMHLISTSLLIFAIITLIIPGLAFFMLFKNRNLIKIVADKQNH